MKKARCYRNLFLIAAVWNLVAGISCWLGGIFMPDLFFGMFGMPLPVSLFPFHAMFWFIIAFGIGYLIVSRDISKNHGIVLIGLIAKVLFFIDCLITLTLNEANLHLLLTGIIDLIFAVLFAEFLLRMRKPEALTSE
jgi:hypothetical protein